MKNILVELTPEEVEKFVVELGQKRFRSKQILVHVYQRLCTDFNQMTDLPKSFRAALNDSGLQIHTLTLLQQARSKDGTTKYAFQTRDGLVVESVLIPMEEGRWTQCISSQIGCNLKCAFCKTGKLGLKRNLTKGEIVDQVLWVKQLNPDKNIRNFVFMGMGEPLLNYDNVVAAIRSMIDPRMFGISPRRITVSTAGVVPGLQKLASEEELTVQLAVSLNAPDDELRSKLMPINRKWNLSRLLEVLRSYPLPRRRRITIEYVLLSGVNDSPKHAEKLAQLLRGLAVKINLIPFNSYPGSEFSTPSLETVSRFAGVLVGHHYTVTVRQSKGEDISAACGQLAGTLLQQTN